MGNWRIFREWLVSSKRKMACQNRNVLLILDQCSTHNNEGLKVCMPVILATKHHHQSHATTWQNIIYCIKRAWWMHPVHFVTRNRWHVPTANITKWNILDAMRSVTVSWESIMPVLIQNRFAKCGFDTLKQSQCSRKQDGGIPRSHGLPQ
jgi:hypothetical protein